MSLFVVVLNGQTRSLSRNFFLTHFLDVQPHEHLDFFKGPDPCRVVEGDGNGGRRSSTSFPCPTSSPVRCTGSLYRPSPSVVSSGYTFSRDTELPATTEEESSRAGSSQGHKAGLFPVRKPEEQAASILMPGTRSHLAWCRGTSFEKLMILVR